MKASTRIKALETSRKNKQTKKICRSKRLYIEENFLFLT